MAFILPSNFSVYHILFDKLNFVLRNNFFGFPPTEINKEQEDIPEKHIHKTKEINNGRNNIE